MKYFAASLLFTSNLPGDFVLVHVHVVTSSYTERYALYLQMQRASSSGDM